MPYSDAQARLIMARAHGAKMRNKGMTQKVAKKMMAEIPAKQRSSAMRKRRSKHRSILDA